MTQQVSYYDGSGIPAEKEPRNVIGMAGHVLAFFGFV
jgi:hypothetical protein